MQRERPEERPHFGKGDLMGTCTEKRLKQQKGPTAAAAATAAATAACFAVCRLLFACICPYCPGAGNDHLQSIYK